MEAATDASFKKNYQVHLQHLKLKGLQPKTIEAYSRAIRRIGARSHDDPDPERVHPPLSAARVAATAGESRLVASTRGAQQAACGGCGLRIGIGPRTGSSPYLHLGCARSPAVPRGARGSVSFNAAKVACTGTHQAAHYRRWHPENACRRGDRPNS